MLACSFKDYVARVHSILTRRKKAKRMEISAPFDFKKEDSVCVLDGISDGELAVLREKAAASVIGSATMDRYPDSPPPPPGMASFASLSVSTSALVSGPRGLAACDSSACDSACGSVRGSPLRGSSLRGSSLRRLGLAAVSGSSTSLPSMSMPSSPSPPPPSPTPRARSRRRPYPYPYGSPMSYHPVVLMSTEPYVPAGLSLPSSSASSIASLKA